MSELTLISVKEFCAVHGIEQSYIITLREYGLITLEKDDYISITVLPKVEKIIRFQKELDINFEGIDVIMNLLDKLDNMSSEMNEIKNRLRLYED